MKRFLKYDTEDYKSKSINVDKDGIMYPAHPDWNQNDPTKPDYVKNRPFYTGDPVETVLVEEQTVAFSDLGEGYGAHDWPTDFDAVEGQTYKISWDGTMYECVCSYYNGIPLIGNMKLLGFDTDTGEPFIFVNQGAWTVYATSTDSEHSISISAIVSQVTKIDEKYLPIATDDNYGIVKKSEVVTAYNFPEDAPHDEMVEAIAAFLKGKAEITWNAQKIISAEYSETNDTISVIFAAVFNEIELYRYENINGFYRYLYGNVIHQADRIYIHSSSVNSEKVFQIMVDDSGTITATEVT